MPESPIFVKTHALLLWLIPQTLRFAREQRFVLAQRIQTNAFAFRRLILEAAKSKDPRQVRTLLENADLELTELRLNVRLSQELGSFNLGQYEHCGRMLEEIGKLLGGWQKKIAATHVA